MTFGAFQASKSYRQLWRRPATRVPPLGRGAASLVLGSDALDEAAVLQSGDRISVTTSGMVNDAKRLETRGVIRLNESPPVGYGWRISVAVGAFSKDFDFTESVFGELNFPVEFSLDDVAINVAGIAGVTTLGYTIELIQDPTSPGPAGVDVPVVLPSVYFDQILAPELVASNLYIGERFPAPAATNVPVGIPAITFTLSDVAGIGVDLANTTVTVDGSAVYSGGAFVAPWSGFAVVGVGPTGNDVAFTLFPPATGFTPLGSEQVVRLRVVSSLGGGGSPIDESWAFTAADTIPPAVQTAMMRAKTVLRVTFTDDVRLDASTAGALNPQNYNVARLTGPSVRLNPVSVATVPQRTDAVDVTFDVEASQGADYSIRVRNVLDDGGNLIDPVGRELRFKGFVPPKPAGRRFELLDFIPDFNIAEDRTAAQGGCANQPGSGDLRRFMLVLQDVVDLLLCSIDEWPQIFDIDLAPEQFLDAILQDLGNPFIDCIADLSELEKRRLARILISIYKEKGTEQGLINAIRFFTGVEVMLDIVNCRQFWQLDISLLGLSTFLAPRVGSPLWYSFAIRSPIVLTDEQRQRILCIADYMKAAHEHILGIFEPGVPPVPTQYWILNKSLLGAALPPNTLLSQ